MHTYTHTGTYMKKYPIFWVFPSILRGQAFPQDLAVGRRNVVSTLNQEYAWQSQSWPGAKALGELWLWIPRI